MPSRVIHIRKLPSDVTEGEVISLGLPFGKVTNLLMLKGKNQVCGPVPAMASGLTLRVGCRASLEIWAWLMPSPHQAFIEMNTEEAANTMVNYYTSVTPVLRGQPIYIQFSNHKELKTDSSPNQAVRHPFIRSGGWVGVPGMGLGTDSCFPHSGPRQPYTL